MDPDELTAHATILALRASVNSASTRDGDSYLVSPSSERLDVAELVALLREKPKRLLCSAARDGAVLVITGTESEDGSEDNGSAKSSAFGTLIRQRYGISGDARSILLTDGNDSILLSADDVDRWQNEYVIVGSSMSVRRASDREVRLGASVVISLSRGNPVHPIRIY